MIIRMVKIEQDLEQLFEKNFDCYANYNEERSKDLAMTKDVFVKTVSNLLKCECCGKKENIKDLVIQCDDCYSTNTM